MKHSHSGFTLVELAIVIVVIGILAGIVAINFNNTQREGRDSIRATTATAISEGLEKYYEQNGEYPSVRSLVNSHSDNTAEVVSDRLGIPENSLKFPNTSPSSATALSTDYSAADDYIGYLGEGANHSSCYDDINGGCTSFTLVYQPESTDETRTIESRYRD